MLLCLEEETWRICVVTSNPLSQLSSLSHYPCSSLKFISSLQENSNLVLFQLYTSFIYMLVLWQFGVCTIWVWLRYSKKVCRKFGVVCSFVCSSSTSPSLSIRWFNFMNLDQKEWIGLLVHIIDCSQFSNTFISIQLRCIWHITNVERQSMLTWLPITSSSLSITFQGREKRKFWNKTISSHNRVRQILTISNSFENQ
jgi:hypothetical protein